ncbi:hypothetical protein JQ594_15455 [Bradyrhizobium manausense]|uniref:hypothetical protein n=1 Tax=Bradyrhizobium manausense TaxID=989370 RepID=UPI001BA77205|nr:hypothetical protein [Bradyrhizobium manausense]MBR0687327.1 hypothetical protein [Bradyrhizobium manausense]
MNIDLPRHAADKVTRALKDVLQLTDDPGEQLRICLLASGVCIGGAGQALTRHAKLDGEQISELDAKLEIVKLLEVLVSKGAEAAMKYMEGK